MGRRRTNMAAEYPSLRIVVTGSRDWSSPQRVHLALSLTLDGGEFLLGVGDCPTGGDKFAREWGTANLIWPVTTFHAPWPLRKRAAGPIRNHFMIDMFRPRLVLAFLRPESRGTVDCADYAESLGIEVRRFREGGSDAKSGTMRQPDDEAVRPGDAASPAADGDVGGGSGGQDRP